VHGKGYTDIPKHNDIYAAEYARIHVSIQLASDKLVHAQLSSVIIVPSMFWKEPTKPTGLFPKVAYCRWELSV